MTKSVPSQVPSAVVDSVRASLDNTYSAFFNEKPISANVARGVTDGPCIAGIISFLGDVNWSLSWILTPEVAPQLARKFAGFDIPFDSQDMGDLAGELVNVIAGEIVSQLEQRRVKSQMSLPTIVRGSALMLVPAQGPTIANLEYTSKEGTFWFRVAAAAASSHAVRVSGR